MKRRFRFTFLLAISGLCLGFAQTTPEPESAGAYKLGVEGFDWGPAVNKVILDFDSDLEAVPEGHFEVRASRTSELAEIPEAVASGERTVLTSYVSDSQGHRAEKGRHLTLVLSVGPQNYLASAFHYARNEKVRGNFWVDYGVSVTHQPSGRSWTSFTGKTIGLADRFSNDGVFEYSPGKSLTFSSFEPTQTEGKRPLIIWLHGGGEGGTDPTIALLGNRAANYASPEIQRIFGGAYVLVPQTPTFWMNAEGGGYTRGETDDIYHEGLMALIEDYVERYPQIDRDRIYVGGCSNGGYMSLKLILEHPEYFAAGFISALAYQSQYISDAQVESIRNVPIWFIHSKDDPVTLPDETVVPLYSRLKAAGAQKVHFSYYDHVTDISAQYGGSDFHYNGHWSWIYSHANKADRDFDGSPVRVNGMPVTIMQWLAAQRR